METERAPSVNVGICEFVNLGVGVEEMDLI